MRRRALVWLIAALLCAWPSLVQAVDAAWAVLRVPGSVVVVRHSYAPGSFDPPEAMRLDRPTMFHNPRGSPRAMRW